MFFSAVMLPVAYTSLAKGDTVTFLTMEVIYDIFCFTLIAAGYYYWGITGTGVALSVASLLDVVMISVCYSRKYGFKFFSSTIRLILFQTIMLISGVVLCLQGSLLLRILLGGCVLCVSAFYSFMLLQKKTAVIKSLKEKFFNRINNR
jgi:hypothetical protein